MQYLQDFFFFYQEVITTLETGLFPSLTCYDVRHSLKLSVLKLSQIFNILQKWIYAN